MPGFATLRRLPRDDVVAAPEERAARAARRTGRWPDGQVADRQRSHREPPGTRSSSSTWTPAAGSGAGPTSTASSSRCFGQAMADRVVLMIAYDGDEPVAGHAEPRRPRHALRPLLGCDTGGAFSALRTLLLSGGGFRHRARPQDGRGGRAGRAQAGARLCAGDDAVGALDRPRRPASRCGQLCRGRAAVGDAGTRRFSATTRRSARASGSRRIRRDVRRRELRLLGYRDLRASRARWSSSISTLIFDVVHWLLHRWGKSKNPLLRTFSRWHWVHHSFLDRKMRVHGELVKQNIIYHVIPEYLTSMAGTVIFFLVFPWPPVVAVAGHPHRHAGHDPQGRGHGLQPHDDEAGERAAEPRVGRPELPRDAPHLSQQLLLLVHEPLRPAVRDDLRVRGAEVRGDRRRRRLRRGAGQAAREARRAGARS